MLVAFVVPFPSDEDIRSMQTVTPEGATVDNCDRRGGVEWAELASGADAAERAAQIRAKIRRGPIRWYIVATRGAVLPWGSVAVESLPSGEVE